LVTCDVLQCTVVRDTAVVVTDRESRPVIELLRDPERRETEQGDVTEIRDLLRGECAVEAFAFDPDRPAVPFTFGEAHGVEWGELPDDVVPYERSRETLVAMGIDADRTVIVEDFIRTRDRERLAVQQAEGIYAGIDLLRTRPTPTPLSEVHRGARALNQEAGELITGAEDEVEG